MSFSGWDWSALKSYSLRAYVVWIPCPSQGRFCTTLLITYWCSGLLYKRNTHSLGTWAELSKLVVLSILCLHYCYRKLPKRYLYAWIYVWYFQGYVWVKVTVCIILCLNVFVIFNGIYMYSMWVNYMYVGIILCMRAANESVTLWRHLSLAVCINKMIPVCGHPVQAR